VIWDLYG